MFEQMTLLMEVIQKYAIGLMGQLLKISLPLTAISFTIGLVIAIFLALMKLSNFKVLKSIASFYISIIRGTPLLVQIFIIFYGLPNAGILIDSYPSAILAFSINIGAYASEIIRASILSIDHGQWEAAKSMGMTYAQTLVRIILPQAARIAVPPLSNSLISLVKDTALASIVLVPDIFRKAQEIAATQTRYILPIYILVALEYWLVVILLTKIQDRIEKHLNRYVGGQL